MAFIGNLSYFDHKNGEWSIFKGRLSQFLKVNNVKEDNRSAILIYRLVRNLAYPTDIETLNYEQLIDLLDKHFKQKLCSDKSRFYGATRSPDETLGDWAARLRGLASYCNFGTALETIITDRLVLGLGSGPERDKLFEQNVSTLDLTRALEMAEQAESAREARAIASANAGITVKDEPIYRAHCESRAGKERRRNFEDSSTNTTGVPAGSGSGNHHHRGGIHRCSVCGMKNHDSKVCRFKNYRCQKCGNIIQSVYELHQVPTNNSIYISPLRSTRACHRARDPDDVVELSLLLHL
ncbi:LOW QUALITY PROTEIN: uncharacterized protein ACR2FA_005288 [Aphomia sociella]